MDNNNLKLHLIESLEKVYYMEAFSQMAEFLQGELYLLKFLAINRDQEFNPSELSEKLHMSRPRITTAISALRKKNYVTTELDEVDRRRLKIKATENGIAFVMEKQKKVEENFDLFISGIGEKDTLELIRIVDLAAEIMGNKDNKDIKITKDNKNNGE